MTNEQTMSVELRESTGKGVARKLRAKGKVPGVLYGENEPAQAIELDANEFDSLRRAGAHHRLFDVSVGPGQPLVKALVREMQVHPVSRAVLHVDLQRISMQKSIRVTVPIHLNGKPEGVRNQGGILEHNLREVELECLPGELPDHLELDVTDLNVGQSLHISDLQQPGVTFLGHPGTTVASVSLPAAERAHEEEAAVEGEAAAVGEEGAEAKEETGESQEKGSS
jgi:large subunit ribosomal protein L25